MSKNISPKGHSTVIAFRLDDDGYQALATRAESLGVSVHELARHYVTEALLASTGLSQLGEALTAIAHLLRALREDQALTAEVLLASAGSVDAQEAEAWVKANLNQP